MGTRISRASTFAVPPGSIGKRHARVQHAICHFVDGAVAAGRDNQVAPGLNLPPRLTASRTRTLRGNQVCFDTLTRQNRECYVGVGVGGATAPVQSGCR